MLREEVIRRLQQHQADLKQLGVEHLYLFGSTARGEAREDSDVDLFFDHEKGKLGLFELMDVKERAAGILGRKTDIMTRNSLHPRLRKRIEPGRIHRVLPMSMRPIAKPSDPSPTWRASRVSCRPTVMPVTANSPTAATSGAADRTSGVTSTSSPPPDLRQLLARRSSAFPGIRKI
jgi:predicted nucleotidyltransferase